MKRFLAIKTSIAALSILAFFFIAIPAQADWVDDLKPLPAGVTYIGVKFQGDDGIVVLKTKSGSCVEYKVYGNVIAKMRSCDNGDWRDFVKK